MPWVLRSANYRTRHYILYSLLMLIILTSGMREFTGIKGGWIQKNMTINEDELLERLVPKIESRISSKIVQRIIDALNEELYTSEDMIRKEFVI